MSLREWDERYRAQPDADAPPSALLIETARRLEPGRALDLACGTGRHALWLAAHGWKVTAVDGSALAIDILCQRARERTLALEARVADLEKHEYRIEPSAWDLIVIFRYLQRDLFAPAALGLRPGGVLLAVVLITAPGEEPTYKRLTPGELSGYLLGFEILHSAENGKEAAIVARRPTSLVSVSGSNRPTPLPPQC